MPIAVACSSCGYTGQLPDEFAAKTIPCPRCEFTLSIAPPAPAIPPGTPPWAQQFVQMLADHSIMTAGDAWPALAAVPPAERADAPRLAQALAKQGKLTWYQAALVSQGKPDQLVLGNYVLLDKIGEGGFGTVFKARHRRMQRIVALKVLLPEVTRNPQALQRFQREVEAAAQLNHPNIVTAFDADEARGAHFLAMEFVDGLDLGRLLKKQGTLPPEQAVNYVAQAGRGLAHAHAGGIIHRDVKPSNLLVSRSGVVKVSDLGLARVVQPERGSGVEALTATRNIMGTVDYMSPEQALNTKNVDPRADIYSLGCTLATLLTGRPVYPGNTALEIVLAHRELPIPALPPHAAFLQNTFARMVAKRPEDRPPSMAHAVAELEQHVKSGAVPVAVALPASGSYSSAPSDQSLGPVTAMSGIQDRATPADRQALNETATTMLPAYAVRPRPASPGKRKLWLALGAAGVFVLIVTALWIALAGGGGSSTGRTDQTLASGTTDQTDPGEANKPRPPEPPPKELHAQVRQCVRDGKVRKTNIIGGAFANQDFEELPKDGGILVGFDVGLGRFVTNNTIGYLRPIYQVDGVDKPGNDIGKRPEKVVTIRAKKGYAVGGLRIGAGGVMDGMAITFMRQKGKFLDPADQYESEWQGGGGGGAGTRIGGDGSVVIGLVGKTLGDGQPGRLGLLFPDIPTDWIVIFRSDDPKIWNDDVNKGPNHFAKALELLPDTISHLRMTNMQSKDFVILEITKQRLKAVSDEGGHYGWEGTNQFHYNVYHLGIFFRIWPVVGEGDVIITRHGPARGWGFGDLPRAGQVLQGYSWAGKPIDKTVFETTPLPRPP